MGWTMFLPHFDFGKTKLYNSIDNGEWNKPKKKMHATITKHVLGYREALRPIPLNKTPLASTSLPITPTPNPQPPFPPHAGF